jgi:acetolactate synthase small subunit
MLIKVAISSNEERMEIRQIAQDFRARIVDVHTDALMFEVTGGSKKIDAFIAGSNTTNIVIFVPVRCLVYNMFLVGMCHNKLCYC